MPSGTSEQPLDGTRGALTGRPEWHGLCASLHCVETEKHEGKNEWGLAIQIALSTVVAVI